MTGESITAGETAHTVAQDFKSIIIRNVPESLRRELKVRAAKDGKTMQGLILELITRHVGEKQGE